TIIDDSGVLYLGRFLYLDILTGTNRILVCVGACWLYRADHCDHHSAGTIAYAAVCRRTLYRDRYRYCVCDYGGFALFSAIDQTRSGSRAGKFAGRAISINATLYQAWRW